MHLIIIYCRVKSNCRPAFLRRSAALSETARAEPGNLAFGYFEDTVKPGRFTFVEEWASREDVDRHLSLTHTQAFFGAAHDMFFEPPSMRIIEAGRIDPLELRVSQ
jgi:quinol monooxygenase YgiN